MENVSAEMNMPQKPTLKRRSRFSFSLRSLLICVTLFCLGFVLIPSERQRQLCQQIYDNGGYCRLKTTNRGTELVIGRNGKPLSYQENMKWYECYSHKISRARITDDLGIRDWSGFPNLTALDLSDEWKAQNVMSVLNDLALQDRITDLSIREMYFNKLAILSQFKNLKKLTIRDVHLSDQELLQFLTFSHLDELDLKIGGFYSSIIFQPGDDIQQINYAVIQQAVEKLKTKIPKVKINFEGRNFY